jgi:hypothetical protein
VKKNIHIVTAFSRFYLLDKLIQYYEPMNIIWHPIVFASEEIGSFNKSWIEPLVIPDSERKFNGVFDVGYYKKNFFIQTVDINPDDYYCILDDDDGIEANVFEEIKNMDDDIIFISLKRGYNIPKDTIPERRYDISTLIAAPENVEIGKIGQQQYIVKGKIFKLLYFNEHDHCADGYAAIWLKENYSVKYEKNLYALFNYFEPGRWNQGTKISFGCITNDPLRLDMVLKRSQIQGSMNFIQNAESATKGLNILLDKAENEGADICCLVHQDMYFRFGWIDQVKSQIKLLPDSWVVAGVIGKDASGLICGKFHDMRIPDYFDTSDIHTFPHPACCFDEAVIIVNMKSGFRFDESLTGFDLYGTLCVLQTWEMGGTAWIIDAFCEHYCMRSFKWFPCEMFIKNYKMLHDRFNEKWKLDSTALGLSPDAEERLEQLREFMTSAGPEVEVTA